MSTPAPTGDRTARLRVGGMLIGYQALCPRKAWQSLRGLWMEQESDAVAIGRLIRQTDRPRGHRARRHRAGRAHRPGEPARGRETHTLSVFEPHASSRPEEPRIPHHRLRRLDLDSRKIRMRGVQQDVVPERLRGDGGHEENRGARLGQPPVAEGAGGRGVGLGPADEITWLDRLHRQVIRDVSAGAVVRAGETTEAAGVRDHLEDATGQAGGSVDNDAAGRVPPAALQRRAGSVEDRVSRL
jgi:hypothetical protein